MQLYIKQLPSSTLDTLQNLAAPSQTTWANKFGSSGAPPLQLGH